MTTRYRRAVLYEYGLVLGGGEKMRVVHVRSVVDSPEFAVWCEALDGSICRRDVQVGTEVPGCVRRGTLAPGLRILDEDCASRAQFDDA